MAPANCGFRSVALLRNGLARLDVQKLGATHQFSVIACRLNQEVEVGMVARTDLGRLGWNAKNLTNLSARVIASSL